MMTTRRILSFTLAAIITLGVGGASVAAGAQSKSVSSSKVEAYPSHRERRVSAPQTSASLSATGEAIAPSEEAAIQAQINSIYQNFYNSYRLGAGDIIAIYVDRHPQDTVERTTVSPFGQVYYPLLGNVSVAGKTLGQVQDYFTAAVSEYIKDPRVTLSLLEANSAKIGVLGDVRQPGVVLLSRPMRVLDAITATGGISETGNSSSVSILRQYEDGSVKTLTVDVKKILKGQANPEENAYLRAGDTIIVHGNLFKKIGKVTSVLGLTSFVTFLTNRGR